MTPHPLDPIVAALAKARRILLLTHVHPDPDALGSQLGLGKILAGLGKEVVLYSEEKVSHLYDFLPGSDLLNVGLPELAGFDCAVALDCGDAYRLGEDREALLAIHPFLVLDHHAGHQEFGDLRWVDPTRAATGEMVYDLAVALKATIPTEAAYCLYTAIVADTGSFKYSSTSADTFRVAGELLAYGVKPAEVAGKLFDNFTLNRLQLLKLVLETLTLHDEQKIAMITATHELFARSGADPADTEGFINYPRALSSVKVAVFLKEPEPGLVTVSLRSKGSAHDVAKVAARFGGGGHRNAAGFKMRDTTIDELAPRLLTELLPLTSSR